MWEAQDSEQFYSGNNNSYRKFYELCFYSYGVVEYIYIQDELVRVHGPEAVANLEQNADGSKDGEGTD